MCQPFLPTNPKTNTCSPSLRCVWTGLMMKSQTMMKQKQQKQRTPPPDMSLAAATALPLTVFLLVARVPASASSGTGEVREGVLKVRTECKAPRWGGHRELWGPLD
uniref:Uncharacterized protein n=1 Tax=Chromera velia CCMP2878 TaxID=1169474 RepID=A0A0G4HP47_9ALVE|eukprot:Cvel_7719.t1-p1 / transcript=Cvel_7719.t1 / gene=Cvel_7719 / organism=Chromera_velia_CCMP2878 / gene_product=hypothetical protein / transcript_product=hypothetical protein / location=Cvel_scaffold410:51121-51435(+) / protein_length=105 / sequence_SO=supercontig / SO=protein_coding / is_pseudo=false